MNNHPPLPDSMTLTEAAIALTGRTGTDWTARHILGRAVHHEIQINARIGHAVRLVRSEPLEGEQNEILGPAGCLPPLSTNAVRALLNADEAEFDGWEHRKTIDFLGVPAEVWVMAWKLAPGEVAPVVRFENCRVSDSGVLQLADAYTTPSPAPAVTDTAAQPKPLQRTAAQDAVILCEIKKQGHNPLELPKNPNGKPGVKAAIRTALSENSLFRGSTTFDKAWERLTARADIVIKG